MVVGYSFKVFSSTHSLQGGTLTGRFVQHKLKSANLGSERTVTVRYPDAFDPAKEYPVVYLQDGQNMFDSRTGFQGKEWQVDETFSKLARQGRVRDAFLVAVDNGGEKRLEEYTHVEDPEYKGGKGAAYESFFMNELLPAVESAYPVDSSKRVMMGSSLGGLVSLAIALNHSAAFAAVGALSPSVWWAGGFMPDRILQDDQFAERPRIWLDMGTEEGGSDEYGTRRVEEGGFSERPTGGNGVQDVRDRTRETGLALLNRGWKLDQDLRYHEPIGARHDEHSWAQRMGDVTEWLMRGL